jgi:hypothetical protein
MEGVPKKNKNIKKGTDFFLWFNKKKKHIHVIIIHLVLASLSFMAFSLLLKVKILRLDR